MFEFVSKFVVTCIVDSIAGPVGFSGSWLPTLRHRSMVCGGVGATRRARTRLPWSGSNSSSTRVRRSSRSTSVDGAAAPVSKEDAAPAPEVGATSSGEAFEEKVALGQGEGRSSRTSAGRARVG